MDSSCQANQIISQIERLLSGKQSVIVAIDGRCAAGKTTLGTVLSSSIDCNIFHMDDFFLPSQKRTANRLEKPGENVDHERFKEEILEPVSKGLPVSFRAYDCRTDSLCEPERIIKKPVNIIEGSYSCHPDLWDFYDLRVFVNISAAEQKARIISRNGAAGYESFEKKWIPLEEKYFSAFSIMERCDLCFESECLNS